MTAVEKREPRILICRKIKPKAREQDRGLGGVRRLSTKRACPILWMAVVGAATTAATLMRNKVGWQGSVMETTQALGKVDP